MLKISWIEGVSNEEVLRRAGVRRTVINEIRVKQLIFLGHVLRKGGLQNLALTGKMDGKSGSGRRRIR